jgi:hypothetical protein
MSAQNANNDLVWSKYLGYLRELAPRVYIPKSVKTLTEEALRASPDDERLLAVREVLEIISRPEPASKSSKFTF